MIEKFKKHPLSLSDISLQIKVANDISPKINELNQKRPDFMFKSNLDFVLHQKKTLEKSLKRHFECWSGGIKLAEFDTSKGCYSISNNLSRDEMKKVSEWALRLEGRINE